MEVKQMTLLAIAPRQHLFVQAEAGAECASPHHTPPWVLQLSDPTMLADSCTNASTPFFTFCSTILHAIAFFTP